MEKVPVRWMATYLFGFTLGIITSIIPLLLWRKLALNQGMELTVDILIILFLVLGVWLFIRNWTVFNSALIEGSIVILVSSIITAMAVLAIDRYNYEPITLALLSKGFPASLIFGIPSWLLLFVYLKIYQIHVMLKVK